MRRAIAPAAMIAIALGAIGCRGGAAPQASGATAAAGMIAGLRAAVTERAPWRCAQAPAPTPPFELRADDEAWPVFDGGVHGKKQWSDLRIGVIAEARAASAPTMTALAAIHRAFVDAKVDVVVTAGGMGGDRDELARTLGAIVDARWPVIAIPGDRESIPAMRAAIDTLRGGGAAIVDGTSVRLGVIGPVVIETMPGAPSAARLGAGVDGCLRDRADLDAALAALGAIGDGAHRPLRVLISATAPRQIGEGSDAVNGVHAGEPDLAAAIATAPPDLIIHAALGDRASVAGHEPRAAKVDAPTILAVGAADGEVRYDDGGQRIPPRALVITVDGATIRWTPVVAN